MTTEPPLWLVTLAGNCQSYKGFLAVMRRHRKKLPVFNLLDDIRAKVKPEPQR